MQRLIILAVMATLWTMGTQAHESTGGGGDQTTVAASDRMDDRVGPVSFQRQPDSGYCWSAPDNKTVQGCGTGSFKESSCDGADG